jgi:glucose/arabinose dehydrogenase
VRKRSGSGRVEGLAAFVARGQDGDLKQRIRDIRQGPDGLIYLLTDENHGAILKLEPLQGEQSTATAAVR